MILVEEKLGQLKLSSSLETTAAAAKKKQNFLLSVDLNGAETASIRRAYEHADVEKALKEARETAKKVSTYVGLHPSWRLYQELQFLLFQLARAGAELGATEEGDQQQQQQLQTMGYHLGEAGDHIAYRYRAISIASRKAKCMSSSGKSFSAAAAAPVFTFTAENRLLQFKLNDYSSANYTPYAARLPKCWRFLQVKLLPNSGATNNTPDLLFARFQADRAPLFFRVSTRGQTKVVSSTLFSGFVCTNFSHLSAKVLHGGV